MFSLVSNRYERASMIVTSNKPFSAWGEIFGDDMAATAMIDRLIHHSEILSLKGDSYRLRGKELDARPARPAALGYASPSGLPDPSQSPASRYGPGVVEGLLRSYYFQLRLSVDGYAYPHFNTGRDGNALACRIVIEDTEIADSYLRHHPTLHTYQLTSFTDQLRTL